MRYSSDKLLGSKKRIWELDFLRGLSICLMCIDHLMYDLSILPSFFSDFYKSASEGAYAWWDMGYSFFTSSFRSVCHYIFASLFIFVSGISCTLSRSNGARCIKLFIFAAILTTVTALIDSVMNMGALIIFGIIHCIAVSVLIYILVDKILIDKLLKNDIWLLIFGAAFILAGIFIPWYDMKFVDFDLFGAEGLRLAFKTAFGFIRAGSDHFPLFPCCGLLLWGAYFGKKFYAGKKSLLPMLDGSWNRSFGWIGRRTVWVYMFHQPVVAGLIIFFGLINGLEVF